MLFKAQVDDIKAHSAKLQEFAVNFEAIAIVNSMLIENVNMQMEAEIADLLDRRMMSLFGVNQKTVNKVEVQNTTRRLQKAQHITTGGYKVPTGDSFDPKSTTGEPPRQSFTIGINQNKTFSTIDPAVSNLDTVNDERVTIENEFKNAKDALKATG